MQYKNMTPTTQYKFNIIEYNLCDLCLRVIGSVIQISACVFDAVLSIS